MGFLNNLESLAGQTPAANNAKVAGGVVQALEEHPGGLGAILNAFRNHGLGNEVQNWSTGQQPKATPEQIQQGLSGTGFIERVAEKAGVSPEIAKVAMTTILPAVIAHFTHNGQQPPPSSGYSGLAGQLLSRFL